MFFGMNMSVQNRMLALERNSHEAADGDDDAYLSQRFP